MESNEGHALIEQTFLAQRHSAVIFVKNEAKKNSSK